MCEQDYSITETELTYQKVKLIPRKIPDLVGDEKNEGERLTIQMSTRI